MNRQSRALLTILIVVAVLAPYWWFSSRQNERPSGDNAVADRPIPQRGGSAVATTRTDPRSFNRLTHAQFATELFTMLTLGRLVRINRATQELEPWLAEKWDASADQRTFTLTLREGATWSDGTPFTSDDVLFSFAAAYDARNNSPSASALKVNGQPLQVSARDHRTVVITFPAVFAPGLRLLDNLTMMPKHKLEAAQNAGSFATSWGANTPPSDLVAIGPFVLADYKPGERLIYERNPRYWRKDQRGVVLPYLDRLTLEIVPTLDAEILRLQSQATDFNQESIRADDLETLRPLERQGRIQLHELGVTPNPDAFVFNLRSTRWSKDPRGAWFTRKEFRQALSHAVDRELFADTVYLGAAVPIHGPVTPGNDHWFWPSIPRYEFSRDKAKALLEGLGLRNRDTDEWLEDDAGTEARFTTLVFRGNAAIERSAAVLRDDFRQIGVAIEIVALEPNVVQGRVLSGDFDSALVGFVATDLDPGVSKDFWLSSGSAHFWNPGQPTPATDWERQIDELMMKQTATTDQAERKRLFNEVQRVFSEHLPALYFAAPRVYVAASARLINLELAPIRPPLTWSADTIALKDVPTTTR